MLIEFLAVFTTKSVDTKIQELLIAYIINVTLKNSTSGECMLFNRLFACSTIQSIFFKSMQLSKLMIRRKNVLDCIKFKLFVI